MQEDEEIGKVAAGAPIVICKPTSQSYLNVAPY